MRVGIDARSMAKSNPTGVSRYTHNLISALHETVSEVEIVLTGVKEDAVTLSGVETAQGWSPPPSGIVAHAWEQILLPWQAAHSNIDVLHIPAGNPPIWSSVPVVTTVHDLSVLRHPDWFSRPYSTLYRLISPRTIQKSDHVVAISDFTQGEVKALLNVGPERVDVIYNGIPKRKKPVAPAAPPEPGSYFLYVGSTNPRKNLKRLLTAYREYRSSVDTACSLVLVGPEESVHADLNIMETSGVDRLGYVSDAELEWLYENAFAFTYPSQYEGFGMPILEAMRAGTPVLTSLGGATEEIAGGAAVLVDPLDSADIARGLEKIGNISRNALSAAGRERAQEFSWERSAREYATIYRRVADREGGS